MSSLIKPPRLKAGDTVGIFTPSFPAHVVFREKYLHGVEELKRLGFKVLEGGVTESRRTEGYRTASPKERAGELMELFRNPEVKAIISTIGGHNSSSLLDHLDFSLIRDNPKIFCGYSDVTSLHMAIQVRSGLSTFYGPAVMPSFGEWPHLLPYSENSFLRAAGMKESCIGEIAPPDQWSSQIRDIPSGAWKSEPRQYQPQPGWQVIQGSTPVLNVEAPLLIANLNTLLTLMGTRYFPSLAGKIVVLEEMNAAMSQQERSWTQLRQSGALKDVKALIVGKPEVFKSENAPFSYMELIEEVLQGALYPRIYNFDCGHTSPMITLAQGTLTKIDTSGDFAKIYLLEEMIS